MGKDSEEMERRNSATRPAGGPAGRRGQAMVEYAIILVLVAVVVVVVLITQGAAVKNVFSDVSCSFSQCAPPPHHEGD